MREDFSRVGMRVRLITHLIGSHEVLRGGDGLIVVEGLDLTSHTREVLLAVVVSSPGLK